MSESIKRTIEILDLTQAYRKKADDAMLAEIMEQDILTTKTQEI